MKKTLMTLVGLLFGVVTPVVHSGEKETLDDHCNSLQSEYEKRYCIIDSLFVEYDESRGIVTSQDIKRRLGRSEVRALINNIDRWGFVKTPLDNAVDKAIEEGHEDAVSAVEMLIEAGAKLERTGHNPLDRVLWFLSFSDETEIEKTYERRIKGTLTEEEKIDAKLEADASKRGLRNAVKLFEIFLRMPDLQVNEIVDLWFNRSKGRRFVNAYSDGALRDNCNRPILNQMLIRLVEEKGADIFQESPTFFGGKQSPLCIAAGAGNVELVKYFLSKGASANDTKCTEMSPLAMAITSSSIETVEVLISAGASLEDGVRHTDFKMSLIAVAKSQVHQNVLNGATSDKIERAQKIVDLLMAAVAKK